MPVTSATTTATAMTTARAVASGPASGSTYRPIATPRSRVFTLPPLLAGLAPCRITHNRSAVTPISRTSTTPVTAQGSSPSSDSPTSAVPVSALSAMGSASLPNSVTRPRRRATAPSTRSVNEATANTRQAAARQPVRSPPWANSSTVKTGTSSSRRPVSAFATLTIPAPEAATAAGSAGAPRCPAGRVGTSSRARPGVTRAARRGGGGTASRLPGTLAARGRALPRRGQPEHERLHLPRQAGRPQGLVVAGQLDRAGVAEDDDQTARRLELPHLPRGQHLLDELAPHVVGHRHPARVVLDPHPHVHAGERERRGGGGGPRDRGRPRGRRGGRGRRAGL